MARISNRARRRHAAIVQWILTAIKRNTIGYYCHWWRLGLLASGEEDRNHVVICVYPAKVKQAGRAAALALPFNVGVSAVINDIIKLNEYSYHGMDMSSAAEPGSNLPSCVSCLSDRYVISSLPAMNFMAGIAMCNMLFSQGRVIIRLIIGQQPPKETVAKYTIDADGSWGLVAGVGYDGFPSRSAVVAAEEERPRRSRVLRLPEVTDD